VFREDFCYNVLRPSVQSNRNLPSASPWTWSTPQASRCRTVSKRRRLPCRKEIRVFWLHDSRDICSDLQSLRTMRCSCSGLRRSFWTWLGGNLPAENTHNCLYHHWNTVTGVNPAGDAGDTHIPTNILVAGRQWEYPHQLLRTFGCSRPILVVLAQWQHLMVSFIHCFARKSTIFHGIDPNPRKKNFKFISAEFTKICNFETTKQKIAPPRTFPGGERNNPSPHPLPSALRPPNFELALTPLEILHQSKNKSDILNRLFHFNVMSCWQQSIENNDKMYELIDEYINGLFDYICLRLTYFIISLNLYYLTWIL